MGLLKRGKLLVLAVLVLLYALTWIGGSACYRRDLEAQSRLHYATAVARRAALAADPEEAQYLNSGLVDVRPGGPFVAVHWCVPVLPGVLWVSSEYAIGPMMAQGGNQLIWYNGLRTGFICWFGVHWIT